ncbi:MAG TPA: ion channel [Phenylobacterium sp.]|jgi:inward rectifier potassium channel|nr:ion channel [Phenylobacterium sp.]
MRQPSARLDQNGFSTVKLGASRFSLDDPYYLVLAMSWRAFLAGVVALLLAVNLVFAAIYWAAPGSLANARPHSFADAFFFSVETLATVGYGEMTPANGYGHVVATVEILVGLFMTALVTGGFFARFARPQPKLIFSRAAVIGPYDGGQALMVRVASRRVHAISEVRGRISYLKTFDLPDGGTFRRFYDLKLVRNENPVLALSWTLIHPIDAQSPLCDLTPERIASESPRLLVSISGFDEAISSQINDRHFYRPEDLLVGHAFVHILADLPDGATQLDLTRIHDTVLVAEDTGQALGFTVS